jgi:hypothetical protein
MWAVAIGRLAGDLQAEAALLAKDLGTTAYEARLSLAGGLPAVVLTTADAERAAALVAAVRSRGHLAVACDGDAVVPSEEMVSMRDLDFDGDAVAAGGARLPFGDVFCMLLGWHKTSVDSRTQETDRQFNLTRAVATSGLVMTKSVTRSTHTRAEEREHVLYVFRRGWARDPTRHVDRGERPWILQENGTVYTKLATLGLLSPARFDNFRTVVRILREGARTAVYDERLTTVRRVPETARIAGNAQNSQVTTSQTAGMDLLAHVLALVIAEEGHFASPYRT